MPHGYTIDVDTTDLLKYSKRHQNGEVTEVEITNRIPGEDWEVKVKDPRGGANLGTFGTKEQAKRKASKWMKNNPKGVPGSNKGISGYGKGTAGLGEMGGGIPGTDEDGLL